MLQKYVSLAALQAPCSSPDCAGYKSPEAAKAPCVTVCENDENKASHTTKPSSAGVSTRKYRMILSRIKILDHLILGVHVVCCLYIPSLLLFWISLHIMDLKKETLGHFPRGNTR